MSAWRKIWFTAANEKIEYDVQVISVYAMIIATINIWKSSETDTTNTINSHWNRHSQYDINYQGLGYSIFERHVGKNKSQKNEKKAVVSLKVIIK